MIYLRCFIEPSMMWLWLGLIVNMSLKSGAPSFLRELWTIRAYLYFIELTVFSILVSKNK